MDFFERTDDAHCRYHNQRDKQGLFRENDRNGSIQRSSPHNHQQFSTQGKWDDKRLSKVLSHQYHEHIQRSAREKDTPVFLDIDDTVNPKKKTSSKAVLPMEGGAFVYSHLLGKTVWGHQAIAALISDGDTALCYKLERCDKNGAGEIEQAMETAASLLETEAPCYALMDIWYTCPKLIDSFCAKGYHTIGALKTNQIICSQGIRSSISEFAAACIRKSNANPVTVGKDCYQAYRYEGKLNGIENTVVLLSYPEKAFGKPEALRAFLCTDLELDTSVILHYYRNRWDIEVLFKQQKNIFGFDGYQMRSAIGIERFWLMLSIAAFYCVVSRSMPLGSAARDCRAAVSFDFAFAIYCAVRDGIPFEMLLLKPAC